MSSSNIEEAIVALVYLRITAAPRPIHKRLTKGVASRFHSRTLLIARADRAYPLPICKGYGVALGPEPESSPSPSPSPWGLLSGMSGQATQGGGGGHAREITRPPFGQRNDRERPSHSSFPGDALTAFVRTWASVIPVSPTVEGD